MMQDTVRELQVTPMPEFIDTPGWRLFSVVRWVMVAVGLKRGKPAGGQSGDATFAEGGEPTGAVSTVIANTRSHQDR